MVVGAYHHWGVKHLLREIALLSGEQVVSWLPTNG